MKCTQAHLLWAFYVRPSVPRKKKKSCATVPSYSHVRVNYALTSSLYQIDTNPLHINKKNHVAVLLSWLSFYFFAASVWR